MKKYYKLSISLFILFLNLNLCYGQTMYVKLKKGVEKPVFSKDRLNFQQKELQNIIGDIKVKQALTNPEKYHSIYAEQLGRTYVIPLTSLRSDIKHKLHRDLASSDVVELVEIQEEPILLSCPTNDPSDADWNISRHEITCVQEAHCITTGDPSIIIAARDNGYIEGHPEHAGQVVYVEPGAYNGQCHGTQTSITSAGATDNGFGISSSGADCSLMLYLWGADFVDDYMDLTDRGARIVHNSYVNGCTPLTTHQTAVNLAAEQGVIVVGSAGNGNGGGNCGGADNNNPTYPASYDNVISVSSVSSNLCAETTFNFWGDPFDPPLHHTHNPTVDLLAQGYAVVTGNCDGGGQAISYGTSIAGPHVAGIIGLMLSVNPCLNHDDVLSILQSTGQDVTGICNNSTYYPGGAPPVPCAESAVIMAQNYNGPTISIHQDTDWDQKFVSGNVIVRSGATLTIHGVASFSLNSKIIVEKNADLIIDGGTLTSCSTEWLGIVIEGDGASGNQDMAGRVVLSNNAIIENARTSISMNPTHISWPATADHWGGLVEAENSTIRNCRRAVEFMKYGTGFIQDRSFFNNCTFENIATSAVTIWSNNNVTFTECTFDNIGNRGIYTYDSEVIVHSNCWFKNQPTGVDILTTYPIPFAPRIGDDDTPANDFECSNYGVFAQAQGNIEPLIVQNNNFLGGTYGFHVNGIANFQVISNDFLGHDYSAVEAISTGGTHSNYVTHNNISSTLHGSHAAFDNSNLEYQDNCFAFDQFTDIWVNSGDIFIIQGSEEVANGNCFTKNGVPEIDNSGNAEIELWVWEDEEPASCEFPTMVESDPSFGIVVRDESLQSSPDFCGSANSPGVINVRTFCRGPFKFKKDYKSLIQSLKDRILAIENNDNLSSAYKAYLIRILTRCLKKLEVEVLIVILEPHDDDPEKLPKNRRIDAAIRYASSLEDFNQKILAYGLLTNTNQLAGAFRFLNSLNAQTAEEIDFVFVQNINLNYLTDVQNYVLSAADKRELYRVGLGTDPLDAYARSLYELLTGERINLAFPDSKDKSKKPGSADGVNNLVSYSIYPNPANDGFINIHVLGTNDVDLEVSIYNVNGALINMTDVNTNTNRISIADWADGLYMVVLKNKDGEIVNTEKVFISN